MKVVVAGSLRPYHFVYRRIEHREILLESIWDQPFCERSEPKGLRKVRPPQKSCFHQEEGEIPSSGVETTRPISWNDKEHEMKKLLHFSSENQLLIFMSPVMAKCIEKCMS